MRRAPFGFPQGELPAALRDGREEAGFGEPALSATADLP
jgi:hypothetical protein